MFKYRNPQSAIRSLHKSRRMVKWLILISSQLPLSNVSAGTVSWVDWNSEVNSEVHGNLVVGESSVRVTFSGAYDFVQIGNNDDTNYWDPSEPYLSSAVSNAPSTTDIVGLNDGGIKTITFSQAVHNPLIALVSWNDNTVDFGVPIQILSYGLGYHGDGIPEINATGTGFYGNGEVHGVIQLTGDYTSITFTDTSEYWHGFTVGVSELSSLFALNVTKPGTGTGTVTSAPTGINCGTTCSANFATGTNVVLTATPAATSTFVNWGSACTGTALTCTVAMTAAKSATATFNLIPVITPPTAITNAASNITATSAKLNGSVKSNGATAAVSFDFGLTTAYGTNIAATPANVFSNTAVAVAATKAGLACGRTYHYRVKAANIKGISYGTNKTFTTAACRRDLIITGATLTPATPVANGTFNAVVTVKNTGTATSNVGFFLDVWANNPPAITSCGAEGDSWVETGMLAAGASRTLTVTGLNAGAAGNKTLRAFVDSWCEVVEGNETNNQVMKAYIVQ